MLSAREHLAAGIACPGGCSNFRRAFAAIVTAPMHRKAGTDCACHKLLCVSADIFAESDGVCSSRSSEQQGSTTFTAVLGNCCLSAPAIKCDADRVLDPAKTLCGIPQDDAEGALEQPLVSVSVGCDAIFLVGGAHRDVPPTAVLLRSGDVVVMAGAARLFSRSSRSTAQCVASMSDGQRQRCDVPAANAARYHTN